MKLRETVRFELAYQARRVWTWLYFAVLVFFAFVWTRENYLAGALNGDYFLNAPFVVAEVVASGCLFWILVAAYVAGDAAARDAETGMFPLTHTAPVRKADYLGGRFLAAFVLNALILLAVPAGILLAIYSTGVEAEVLGPFRPASYLAAYAFIALPNAFVATAVQFSLAALGRRAIASYLGGVLLVAAAGSGGFLAEDLGLRELGKLVDPIGAFCVGELSRAWTTIEKNTLLIGLRGPLLANRLLWLGGALGTLAFTHFRFRLGHPAENAWWSRISRRRDALPSPGYGGQAQAPTLAETGIAESAPISVPQARRTFGLATRARQTLAIAWGSFGSIARSRGGLLLLAVVAMFAVLSVDPGHMGVPLIPRTDYLLHSLTFPDVPPAYLIIPLLIVFCSGRLVWREREAGLSEMVDAAPVPEGVLLLGKFLGLGLVLALCMAFRMTAGMLHQAAAGYYDFEIGLYLQVLFGIQLADYLLLALLALVVHVVVNQKHVGHVVVLPALIFILAARGNRVGHELLAYASDPGWSYTDMRGFGGSLGPWLWFKLYWAAWALLLGVAASLLWVRGRERGLGVRLQLARRRFRRPTTWAAAAAAGLILTLGGFIFYNTNVLNEYHAASDRMERRAEYERRYGRYEGIPQPRLTATDLHVEIYPKRREMDIRGSYRLVNASAAPIDSVHLATEVELRRVDFDRPAVRVLEDKGLGHRIYALEEPLQPGDSLRLDFQIHVGTPGFRNRGLGVPVTANGTYFTNREWLPAIGYQPGRELRNAGDRRAHGLPRRPALPSPYDAQARRDNSGAERIDFEAVVGTDEDQIAVAPGSLRRTWTEGGRRYFRYATHAPIGNEYAFFSADYALHDARWNGVAIEIYHHPGHAGNLERMARSVRASLSHYSEQFGPYPYDYIRLVEHPGHGLGMHAEATTIDYEEGFSLLNPDDGPQGLDLPFFVVAHEVGHQWWGTQLTPARLEGAGLLVESLASYSAYQVVEQTYGQEHLRRLLARLRRAYEIPRTRAAAPLLRANDAFLYYRKGPFAMYALSRYMGEERVNGALRRLLEKHASGTPPLPTSLDLYRELQAAAPGSLQSLLHDLFEANTFWELKAERATAKQTEEGAWQVALDVRARKTTVDSAGVETGIPMNDPVEVGVFAPAQDEALGEPLYLGIHRIHSAEQTIMVTVPRKPARAGIDPRHLLIDLKTDDNVEQVESES